MNSLLLAATVIAGFDWIGISIETGKYDESMSQRYFHSETDCRNSLTLIGEDDDRVCFPVPTLPKEIWDRQNASDNKALTEYYQACLTRANSSWTEATKVEELAKCERLKPRDYNIGK